MTAFKTIKLTILVISVFFIIFDKTSVIYVAGYGIGNNCNIFNSLTYNHGLGVE